MSPIQSAIDQTIALPARAAQWSGRPAPIADDIFQCPATEYPTSRACGAWFRSQHPEADGLQWILRQFTRGSCLVLFDDRCAHDLKQIGTSIDQIAPDGAEEHTLDSLLAEIGWTRG